MTNNTCFKFFQNKLTPSFFKALGDATRLKLFSSLCQCKKPTNVGEIGGCCEVDQSVVSRHLALLKNAGLVASERRGKEVLYSVNYQEVAKTLRAIADYLDDCCKPIKKKGGS